MAKVKIVVSIAILTLVGAAWFAASADEPKKPTDKPVVPNAKTTTDEAKKEPVDPFAVPDGSPKMLVAYITRLISGQPPHDRETLKKMRAAILTAAEKILANKPDDQDFQFAVTAKMNMLDTPEQLAEFAAELKNGGHDAAARTVRGFRLQTDLRRHMMMGDKNVEKSIEEAVQYLQEAAPQLSDLTLAFLAGTAAESTENTELARKTYDQLLKIFKDSHDPKLADFTQILEGVVRRLNLVGQPMQLDGKLLSGGSLDWSKYSGKVVLVVFWAPDYLPCVQAVPSWKEIYEKYHGKGLELLGISLDRDNRTLEDFVKTQSLPWPNVVNSGKTNVNMIRYGVTNLPTTMLVGKDGKVLAVNLGGDALEQKLNSLLGPVESDAVKKSEK